MHCSLPETRWRRWPDWAGQGVRHRYPRPAVGHALFPVLDRRHRGLRLGATGSFQEPERRNPGGPGAGHPAGAHQRRPGRVRPAAHNRTSATGLHVDRPGEAADLAKLAHVIIFRNSHSEDVAYVLQQAFTPGNITAQPTSRGQSQQGIGNGSGGQTGGAFGGGGLGAGTAGGLGRSNLSGGFGGSSSSQFGGGQGGFGQTGTGQSGIGHPAPVPRAITRQRRATAAGRREPFAWRT